MLNKKATYLKFLKKFVSLILASTTGLSSGLALTNLVNPIQGTTSADINPNQGTNSAVGILYSLYDNQNQYLVDSNNMIIDNYVMNAKMNFDPSVPPDDFTKPFPESVDLKFTIPGYDPSNLRFCVFPQEQTKVDYKEYVLDNETGKINLTVSDKTTAGDVDRLKFYEVHVYNGSVSEGNFIGKASFIVMGTYYYWTFDGQSSHPAVTNYPLVSANGNPIEIGGNQQNLSFVNGMNAPSTDWIGDNVMCAMPTEICPNDARSIKVVVFASDPQYRYYKDETTINIDKCMSPFYQNDRLYETTTAITERPYLAWSPSIIDFESVNGQPVKFEFHFYKDSVLEENFLFKAVDVTLPPGKEY